MTNLEGSIGGERHSFCALWRAEAGDIADLWDAIVSVVEDDELAQNYGVFTSMAGV
jgi:hypothetical protein